MRRFEQTRTTRRWWPMALVMGAWLLASQPAWAQVPTITVAPEIAQQGENLTVTVTGDPTHYFVIIASSVGTGFSYSGTPLLVGSDVQILYGPALLTGGTATITLPANFRVGASGELLAVHYQAVTSASPAFAPTLTGSAGVVVKNAAHVGVGGATGPSGPSGPPGTAGAVGPAGPTGSAGADSTVPGPTGPVGPSGPAGPSGGDSTVPGPTGPAGETGPIGPSGPEGPTGATGVDGPSGPSGPEGPSGTAGAEGPTGPSGPSGPQGTQGAEGPTGPSGPSGAQGTQGVAGPGGPTGPTGPAGTAGAQAATVATSESTSGAGTAYAALATAGPAVTVTVPASGNVLVILTATVDPAGSVNGYMSFVSSGGTGDVTANDARALIREHGTSTSTGYIQASATFFVTGLSAGSHTFTAQYRDNSGTLSATFANRSIIVIPMP